MKETSENSASGYITLLRQSANFRTLWFGQIVSLLGDWFNLIASAALLAELTDSGLAVGTLFVLRMLAPFLVSPLAGVVADIYDRKTILITSDLLRALIVLGFLLVREPEHVWLLYALTFLQLGIGGFFYPARNAILPEIVFREQLGTANAISSMTWSVMLGLGAALGGLISGAWGIYQAFVIDSVTFVVSALFLMRIRFHLPGGKDKATPSRKFLSQYLEGLRYLYEQPDILLIAVQKAAMALTVSAGFQVVQVALAESVFPIGKAGGVSLGLLFGIAGLGTGIGPIVARRVTGDRDKKLRWAIFIGYLTTGLGLILMTPLTSLHSVLLANLLRGIGGGMIWVFSTQLLLQLVPGQVLGRVFSTEFAFFTLMSALGAWATGFMIDSSLGIVGTIWLMSGLTLIPASLWALWLIRGLLRQDARGESG